MRKAYSSKQNLSKGHSFKLGSAEIYYECYGSGKPLLLLHGYGGCVQNWYPFVEELSKQYRLILVDLPGHGYSTNAHAKFSHKASTQAIFHLMDHLGIVQFSAMGMSSGGMVLLHMASSQASRIEAQVLISASHYFPEQARNIMRRASFTTMPAEVVEMYKACAKRGEEQIQDLLQQFNAFADDKEDVNFSAASLSAISARTLLVHGERDNFFPVSIPEYLLKTIPTATLWLIEGGEHVPIFDTKVAFASKALAFLNQD